MHFSARSTEANWNKRFADLWKLWKYKVCFLNQLLNRLTTQSKQHLQLVNVSKLLTVRIWGETFNYEFSLFSVSLKIVTFLTLWGEMWKFILCCSLHLNQSVVVLYDKNQTDNFVFKQLQNKVPSHLLSLDWFMEDTRWQNWKSPFLFSE